MKTTRTENRPPARTAAGDRKTATDRRGPGGEQAANAQRTAHGRQATDNGRQANAPHTTDAADRRAVDGRVAVAHLNEVHVIGRVSGAPEVRPLAAGELVVWRMAVERPRPADGARRSDWITCAAAYPGPGTDVRGLRVGDLLEIHGTLRRRFWRSRNGPVTPLEVEVRRAEPVVSAPEAAP